MSFRPFSAVVVALSVGVAACAGGPGDGSVSESEEATKYIQGFPPGSYYQIDTSTPDAGEITLLMFSSRTEFWAYRCYGAGCAQTNAMVGTYKRTKSTVSFYDSNAKYLGTWGYSLSGKTLHMQRIGTSDTYALDPMSEDLCDSSGGSWTDEDLGKYAFNCVCPDGAHWSSAGCVCPAGKTCGATCGAGQSSCGGQCVDLSNDPRNCGACGNTCGKAQGCQNGACGACPSGEQACTGVCVDVSSDPANCGACGNSCGKRACVSGSCQ